MKLLKSLNVFLTTNHLVLIASLPTLTHAGIYFFPISYLLNLSFTTREFPKFWKIAKVITLFWKSDSLDWYNYRSMSLLSTFSTIFAKCIYRHVYSFLDKNNLIFKDQFGSRSGYSSNQIIINLVGSIISTSIMIIMCAEYLETFKKFLIP